MGLYYLCKCTNCSSILYDENPDTTQELIEIDNIEQPILPMEQLNEDGDTFWGCGNCQTDSYLIDYPKWEITDSLLLKNN